MAIPRFEPHIGGEIAKALGLDPRNVRQIDLRFRAGDLATCKVETFVLKEQMDGVKAVLETKEYELRLIGKSEEFPAEV